jgi:hypothetical protein
MERKIEWMNEWEKTTSKYKEFQELSMNEWVRKLLQNTKNFKNESMNEWVRKLLQKYKEFQELMNESTSAKT